MISITALRKGYRRVPLFIDFTWELPPGRTVLLGPNGAGKSTLMHCIAGIEYPQRGEILIDGVHMRRRKAYFSRLGWMPQNISALPGATCLNQVAYAGWLKGMSNREARNQAEIQLERVGLASKSTFAADNLSGGQLRRLGLAEALIGDPKVLVLDEPSVGLDPGQRETFRNVILETANVDCLISTHQVDDIDALFDNVVVLDGGEIQYQGSVQEFLGSAPPGLDTLRAAEHAYRQLVRREA
ncbi:ATP-binding cassette domain-containing protein [Micrococcales bacterium 31B]|nr:ATP-binding cassette domain-containing protein [Micrococcales bacterium 31B]